VEINGKNLRLPEKEIYGGRGYTKEEYDRKMKVIAERLERAVEGAKYYVIGVIEVFDREVLDDLVSRSPALRGATIVAPSVDGSQAQVALITNTKVSKFRAVQKIAKTAQIDEKQLRISVENYNRPVLVVKVTIDGIDIDVWVFHLKSKLPLFVGKETKEDHFSLPKGKARALAQRMAESIGMRQMYVASRRKTPRPCVMMGDGNDSWDAITTTMLTGEDLWGGAPQEEKDDNNYFQLYDAVDLHEKKVRYKGGNHTFIHNGLPSRIDVVYVSRDFHQDNPKRAGHVDNVKVYNDHLFDTTVTTEYPPRWEMDHGIIVVSVLLNG
jgi:hypothetical protein